MRRPGAGGPGADPARRDQASDARSIRSLSGPSRRRALEARLIAERVSARMRSGSRMLTAANLLDADAEMSNWPDQHLCRPAAFRWIVLPGENPRPDGRLLPKEMNGLNGQSRPSRPAGLIAERSRTSRLYETGTGETLCVDGTLRPGRRIEGSRSQNLGGRSPARAPTIADSADFTITELRSSTITDVVQELRDDTDRIVRACRANRCRRVTP